MSDTNKTESLHDQIMRLQCTPPKDANVNQMLAYKSGHRDARHAAAELAAAHEVEQAAPVAVPNESGLLLCPFCGGKAELHQRETESLWSHNQVTWSQVGCCECECVGADCCEDDDGSEAVAHWNTRAADPSAPTPPAGQREIPVAVPGWTEAQVRDFLSVAMRHVEINGSLLHSDINDGLRYMAEKGQPAFVLAAAPTPQAQQIDQLRHERDALAEAIGKAAARVGLVAPDTPLTGPMLLMLCDDIAECCLSAESAATPAQQSQADERREGVEAVAKMIEKKASDYAMEFDHDELGALSFGAGPYAEAKHDYYNTLCELAEEVRAMLNAPGDTAAPEPTATAREQLRVRLEQLEQLEQPAVKVPRELLECYLNGGGDWVEAGNKLRDLLGGGA